MTINKATEYLLVKILRSIIKEIKPADRTSMDGVNMGEKLSMQLKVLVAMWVLEAQLQVEKNLLRWMSLDELASQNLTTRGS